MANIVMQRDTGISNSPTTSMNTVENWLGITGSGSEPRYFLITDGRVWIFMGEKSCTSIGLLSKTSQIAVTSRSPPLIRKIPSTSKPEQQANKKAVIASLRLSIHPKCQ